MNEIEAIELLAKTGCSGRVIEHCMAVAAYAREIAEDIRSCALRRGEHVDIDIEIVYLGGLLHDIGRSRTHGIFHAVEGACIARENGLDEKLVNIIERHIGAGIPREEAADLGLPVKDYMPITLEEKIVAHADNLVSGKRVVSLDELVTGLRNKKINEKIILRIIGLNDEICSMIC
ncbi:MAG: TIGR00295 family protein [Candidatus Methanoperedenaceae archaeon]|nr:TIGR00295 family protein [Candidatus Methanoperedenaceae archaeon]